MADTTDAPRDHEPAIRDLIARYCHHYDDRRPDEFADLFSADATFRVFGRTSTGRDEIRAQIGTQRDDQPPGQHVTYNSVIEVAPDGRSARGASDFCYLNKTDAGISVVMAGRYHDRFVLEDRWRIASRTIVFLGEPVPDDV